MGTIIVVNRRPTFRIVGGAKQVGVNAISCLGFLCEKRINCL